MQTFDELTTTQKAERLAAACLDMKLSSGTTEDMLRVMLRNEPDADRRDEALDRGLNVFHRRRLAPEAQRVDAIRIIESARIEGVGVLVTDCADFDAFEALPHAVQHDGVVYGKTGWNSDRGRAYYRDDAVVAATR